MSKKTVLTLAIAAALAVPAVASAQLSIGARAGTLGIGGEVSFGLTSSLAVRGGISVVAVDIDATWDDVDYKVEPPDRMWNIGVDFYPGGGGFRIGAGLLNRPKWTMSATQTGSQQIGDRTYTGTVTINGELENERETAPYAMIGFGKATGKGLGFFVDLGAAFMGDPTITLTGTCTGDAQCPTTFQSDLQKEADNAEDKAGSYIKVHPIIQIGIRLGLGS